ncbi:hypothetical protein [Pseudomonas sp. Marseille-Q5117]|nr:hypothetical protein [Pseudomonas sp. Marseille-Q5117]
MWNRWTNTAGNLKHSIKVDTTGKAAPVNVVPRYYAKHHIMRIE